MNDNCVFCKIIKSEITSEKIYESDNFIGILDIHPAAEGHTLIIPKKHFKTILDLPNSLGEELLEAIKTISLNLIDEKKAEGFNIVQSNYESAQQEVPHLHFHIIPRKKHDGLNIRFK